MELLYKTVAAVLVAAVVGLLLRRSVPELGFVLSAAVAAAVTLAAAGVGQGLSAVTERAIAMTGLSGELTQPVLKCLGIGIVSRMAADLCADAGQSAAGSAVELCGAVCALLSALPLLERFMDMVDTML